MNFSIEQALEASGISYSFSSFSKEIQAGIITPIHAVKIPLLKMLEGTCKRDKTKFGTKSSQFTVIKQTDFAKQIGDAFRKENPTIKKMHEFLQSLNEPPAA